MPLKLNTLAHSHTQPRTHTHTHAFAIHLSIDKNFCLRGGSSHCSYCLVLRINNDFNMLIDNFLMNFIFAAILPVNRLNEGPTPYVYGAYIEPSQWVLVESQAIAIN